VIDREVLAALADVLIPAGDGMPAASEAGVASALLDEVLAARPDLAEPLARVLEAVAGDDPGATLARLQAEDDAEFDLLATVVAGAYFLSPDVCRRLGYPGHRPLPVDQQPPDEELEALVAEVVSRGPIHRPTPRP
jgi:hypothetical protein